MYRLLCSTVTGCLLVLASGCKPMQPAPPQEVVVDTAAPLSHELQDVVDLCNRTTFVPAGMSDENVIQPGVIVRLMPRQGSHRLKLEHLGRGRIIARIENLGDGLYPKFALFVPKGRSCWYVWETDFGFHSKFVSLDTAREVPDYSFHLDLDGPPHGNEKSDWKTDGQIGARQISTAFRPASTGKGDLAAQILLGPWMWTTCLSNGCCRSRL